MLEFHFWNDWKNLKYFGRVVWLDTAIQDSSTDITIIKAFYITFLNFSFVVRFSTKKAKHV